MQCPTCGATNRDDAAFCLSCRATIPANEKAGTRYTPQPDQPRWFTAYVDRPLDGVEANPTLTGFWDRAVALILDTLIVLLVGVPLAILLRSLGRGIVAVILIVALLAVAYQVITTAHGGSLGMRLMGLRVVRTNGGGTPGYRRAFARVISRGILSAIPVVGTLLQLMDHLWMIWDANKQTWHDKAAGTYVIHR